jgi:hypothetical protein
VTPCPIWVIGSVQDCCFDDMSYTVRSVVEDLAVKNAAFRRVLYTAQHCQLVVRALKPHEEIGAEVHTLDQFFRVEDGTGEAVLDGVREPGEVFGSVTRSERRCGPLRRFGIKACRDEVQPARGGQIECIANHSRTRIDRGIHFDLR